MPICVQLSPSTGWDKMTELVALYIDALDSNHIKPDVTPNLHKWQTKGSLTELSTLFAFKGISAAMYGGVPPSESGVWMDFKVRTTPDRMLGDQVLAAAARLPSGLPRKGAVTAYERLIRGSQVTPHIVPANLRPYFEPHPTKSWTDNQPLGKIPTIFDLFKQTSVSFRTVGLAGGPQDRIIKKMRKIKEYPEDVVLLKLTLLDHVGHKHGPGSKKHNEALSDVDALLGEIAANRDYETLVFSDHGMQTVTGTVDLRSILLDELDLVEEEDFVAFFNSTGALVRWDSEEIRDQVAEHIQGNPAVSLLVDDELCELGIGETKQEFADDVIATKPGIVISPDFYRYTPPKGMHGFVSNPSGGPVGIIPNQQTNEEGKLWDIAPTIVECLSMDIPSAWTGQSFLNGVAVRE